MVAHQKRDDESGAVLVEFALVIGLFMLLVFGMIDYGLGVNSLTQMNNAGREGARLATVNPNETAVRQKILDSISKLDTSELTITITCEDPTGNPCAGTGLIDDATAGDTVIVQLDYKYKMITPLPSFINDDGKFDLRSITEMRVE